MQEWDFDVGLYLICRLVHGVGANDNKIRTAVFQALCGVHHHSGGFCPFPFVLENLHLCEIDRNHDAFRGMKAPEFCLDRFVDDAVILDGRFPAHAADQTDCFHVIPLNSGDVLS